MRKRDKEKSKNKGPVVENEKCCRTAATSQWTARGKNKNAKRLEVIGTGWLDP